MLIEVRNPIEALQEETLVAETIAAGDTSITVSNTDGFSTDDYIIIGQIGKEQTEMRQISSITAPDTIVVSTAVSFGHGIGTTIRVTPYNQVEISRKTSASEVWLPLVTQDLDVDSEFSVYDDVSGQTSHFYRTRFFNSNTGQYTSYSAELKGSGPSTKQVATMIDQILRQTEDPKGEFTTRVQALDYINEAYQEVVNRLIQASSSYFLKRIEIPTEDYKYEYTLPDDFREIQEVRDGSGNIVPPALRSRTNEGNPGYELTGINTLFLNDVPTPASDSTTTPTTVLQNNAYDTDGEWEASGDATNVTTDTDEFKVGTGSINFDVSVAESGNVAILTNDSFTSQDLSDFHDTGKWRLWAYLPDVTYITSIALRWGADSSNYWELSVEKDYKDHAFHDGWNLIEFDWSDAAVTETGTAGEDESEAIDYLQLRITYSSSQADDTDFRLDAITIATSYPANSTYEVTYIAQPHQLVNEMDELQLPPGYQNLLVDYAVAHIFIRHGERDTMAREMLKQFNNKIERFIAQSAKRTRRPIGFSLYGRDRLYHQRRLGNVVSGDDNFVVRKI